MANILPIPGFPGYFASSDGEIFSTWKRRGVQDPITHRLIGVTYTATGDLRRLKGGSLKPRGKVLSTYVTLGLEDGVYKQRNVHCLILETFRGPCPEGMEGCHNDGNPLNNHIDNLRWDTPKNNQADRWLHGTMKFGETHPNAEITDEIARMVKQMIADGQGSNKFIANVLGISKHIVCEIRCGNAWKHVSLSP